VIIKCLKGVVAQNFSPRQFLLVGCPMNIWIRVLVAVGSLAVMALSGQAHGQSEAINTVLQKYVVEIRNVSGARLGVGVVSDSFTANEGLPYTGILCPAFIVRFVSDSVVVLINGKQYQGKLTHTDKVLNVARISVTGVALSPAPRSNDGEPLVKKKVYVIGSSGTIDATTANGLVKKMEAHAGIPFIYTSAPTIQNSNASFIIDDRGNFLGIGGLTVTEGATTLNVGIDVQTIERALAASAQEFLLRYWVEDNQSKYSTNDRSLIAYEHLLGRWLLATSPNESIPRYMAVKNAEDSVWSADPADKNARTDAIAKAELVYAAMLEQFLVQQNTTPLVAAKITKLVCSVSDNEGANNSDLNVEIDYRNSLANGWKADISDGEVRWKSPADKKYETVLNRYTGNIRVLWSGGVMLKGPCQKAETRKF
jgi:hypothetical protein